MLKLLFKFEKQSQNYRQKIALAVLDLNELSKLVKRFTNDIQKKTKTAVGSLYLDEDLKMKSFYLNEMHEVAQKLLKILEEMNNSVILILIFLVN